MDFGAKRVKIEEQAKSMSAHENHFLKGQAFLNANIIYDCFAVWLRYKSGPNCLKDNHYLLAQIPGRLVSTGICTLCS